MKVTYFLGQFPVASETFVINQIAGLIERGVDVEIISIQKGNINIEDSVVQKYDLVAKTTYLLSETGTDPTIKRLGRRLAATLRGFISSKIVHVIKSLNYLKFGHHSKSLLLPSIVSKIDILPNNRLVLAHFGPVGVLANQLKTLGRLNGKLLTVFHGADISRHDVLRNMNSAYQQLFIDGERMLPISQLWYDRLSAMGCPENKITINRMGINIGNFKPINLDKKIKKPLSILSVARFTEKKGLISAILSMKALKNNNIPFTYNIIGGGPLEPMLHAEIEKSDLQDNINIIGFKPQEIVRDYLSKADVFLLPSITAKNGDMEGIPVALMEAMAMGLVTVSTFHSGIPELIENNVSGFLARENSPEELGDHLIRIAQNEFNPTEIRSAALKIVTEKFNQQVIYDELKYIIERIDVN